jgi:peptidoglycan hydrolase-like protein with peptidoglycan-binding domain
MRACRLFSVVFWVAISGAAGAVAQPAPGASIGGLQKELRGLGYDPGPANGVITKKTRRAIAAYERGAIRPPSAMLAAERVGNAVAQAQRALQQLGLLQGRADGVLGPATREAIIRFQIARALPIDPRVGDALLAALAQSAPPAKAEDQPQGPRERPGDRPAGGTEPR